MIESLRTTQIAFFRFATPSGFLGERRRGTKSVRARVRARENPMKPFVRTSFLGTRPSCFPSPGWPLFDTDDRKPILWLGLPGSPVIRQETQETTGLPMISVLLASGLAAISGFFRLRTFLKFTWLGARLDLPSLNFEYMHKSGTDLGNTETVGRDNQQLYPR